MPGEASIPWFQTAVFYEVPVYAFYDSDGDGIGDFPGLTAKLDYLEWLGIDCIWLLPFYESPLRDGGYDVSDFRAVDPRFGVVEDVRELIQQAHRRGIRVIADIIMNHTSDQHPWFQEARRPGSPTRNRYVWTDDPAQWREARVIFTDTHDSNWTWDEEAGAFYWHRFFWHQPDLNFRNPVVRDDMKDVLRFWLDIGFDGLRLDAVPYLFERDGTNGENLPETHDYLKEIRAMVDTEYGERILLAEANQWPQDLVAYFGEGDECHMAFHFPVMPRLFMAAKMEQAAPVIGILQATPPIPPGCQWGIFLRNHDELTLEMVTPEERAYLWENFAPDPEMRKNIGIRRRLAPLLDNDPATIRLFYGLLFSLPGSPFLYYGDEIGMGDMYLLPDREGVRTPMQWTGEPGAGFSTADPDSLYLPVVEDDAYRPEKVSVAAQRSDDASLLNWVRLLIGIRRRHPEMGTGGFEPLACSSPAILAFLRPAASGTVLVVANMSNSEVSGLLEGLESFESDPIFGDGSLAPDGLVILPPRGFKWVKLAEPRLS